MRTERHIRDWRDLREFGIDALTGEACGLMMRILCDVSEKGAEHLSRFLGGHVKIDKGSNWNGGTKEEPSVGSVLLPYSILADLGAFLLLTTGKSGVALSKDGTIFEYTGELPAWMDVQRTWRRSDAPGTGDRNTHAFSGRTE